jgi:hypothetical protein
MIDRPPTLRRTQQFPEADSRSIALSSSALASSFFNWAVFSTRQFFQLDQRCTPVPSLNRVPAVASPDRYEFHRTLYASSEYVLVGHADLTAGFSNILTLRENDLSLSKLLNNLFCLESLAWHLKSLNLRPNF